MNYKLIDRPWAAFIYFTRLPLWRIHQPSRESYDSVVEWWPLVGWLTGGLMAATLYFGSMVFPTAVAVVLAIVVRMLTTGALHEDGLADFVDGFGGGGNNRQRILDIMKDSHIGTYGVLALVVYVLLLFCCLYAMPTRLAALCILAADPYSKMATSQLVMMMPYARTAEQAKSKRPASCWPCRGCCRWPCSSGRLTSPGSSSSSSPPSSCISSTCSYGDGWADTQATAAAPSACLSS